VTEPTRYPDLHATGELARRATEARASLADCALCARRCGADRLAGELGSCGTGGLARAASWGPHFGEEVPLVGRGGSGTVFFGGCCLACVYCQNWDISQRDAGSEVSAPELADVMLGLERRGCENINLVSPTHVVPMVLEALDLAAGKGLHVPLVYNTGTYDTIETLRMLDGVVDVYLPDAKYADADVALWLSGVARYPETMRDALREMYRQVGDLATDERGVAVRGVMVRHLVLPEGLAGTSETMDFIARELGAGTYVNVMAQYRPCHRAHEHSEIARPVNAEDVAQARSEARAAGLTRLDDR
jgi:putative pyruvate formate lyase activating enzyme